jgi:hypothetical protein
VALPGYDYLQQFSEFSFRTLLTKGEVISAGIKVCDVDCGPHCCVCVCACMSHTQQCALGNTR